MVRERQTPRQRPDNRLGGGWLAALAVALMMAGAAMAQGGLSKSTERLFDAVFKNDMAAVKASIPAGADLDAVNSWGQTPADLAVDLGFFDIAHFLTSLRQFEKREKPKSPLPTAGSFLESQSTPPAALEPLSPLAPAPAQAPEPAPPPLPGGAFDPSIASQGSVLPVIGDVRGPEGTALPEAMPPSAAPSPLPRAGVAAKPSIKPEGGPKVTSGPAQPPSPVKPVATVQPAAPALPGGHTAPAEEGPGFISNLWGQLTEAFADEPEDAAGAVAPPAPAEPVAAAPNEPEPKALEPAASPASAEPVAAAPEGEESGFISNMLGLLKDAISAPPEAESAEEPVVAFGEAKPAQEESPDDDTAKAPDKPQVVSAEPPSPVETAAAPSVEPAASAEPIAAPEDEEPGFISNMLGQLKESISAANDSESAEETVVAFSQAKPAPGQEESEGAAKAPGQALAGAEPAKKASESKPKFYERLAKFLSLDTEPPSRVKRRKRARANTETALIRFPIPERPSEFLKGVALNLSGTPDLGRHAPATESCISKNRGRVLFCIEPVAWPDTLLPHFQVSTYMYSGAKSIVRYDDGEATFVHAVFPSASFEAVLDHFERRFGPPTDQQELWLTSLSSPVRSNPMAAWWSIEGSSVTSLQIRKFDDTRGGFPDMEFGAISLHIQGAKPIFPLLSTANLMLLKFKRSP